MQAIITTKLYILNFDHKKGITTVETKWNKFKKSIEHIFSGMFALLLSLDF